MIFFKISMTWTERAKVSWQGMTHSFIDVLLWMTCDNFGDLFSFIFSATNRSTFSFVGYFGLWTYHLYSSAFTGQFQNPKSVFNLESASEQILFGCTLDLKSCRNLQKQTNHKPAEYKHYSDNISDTCRLYTIRAECGRHIPDINPTMLLLYSHSFRTVILLMVVPTCSHYTIIHTGCGLKRSSLCLHALKF